MSKLCRDCGAEFRRDQHATRCLPCANKPRPRIAAADRKRNGVYRRLMLGGVVLCLDCCGVVPRGVNGRLAGSRCRPCSTSRRRAMSKLRGAAASVLAAAIAKGEIPRASECICVDCGRPAEQYDHRDYTKPLEVDPVCRSCNVMRGPADVWPDGFSPLPKVYAAQRTPEPAHQE